MRMEYKRALYLRGFLGPVYVILPPSDLPMDGPLLLLLSRTLSG
jgi:hypothetical protein